MLTLRPQRVRRWPVLLCTWLFQADEVVGQLRRDRACGRVERLECLGDREAGGREPV